MKRSRYSPQQLTLAVKQSSSLRQVLVRLGLAPYGGNYDVVRKACARLSLDTSHFLGRGWSRHRVLGLRKPVHEYLHENARIQSYKLKRRLLKAGVLQQQCSVCQLDTWQGVPIPLELDHINGNRADNRLVNLRLLCPDCHALTPTYRSKRRPGLSSGLQSP
jgi:HNH endonuclease